MVVGGRELIDTLWNVNKYNHNPVMNCLRINRYIMECKSVCFIALLIAYIELIDTLWNVNLITAITCPDSANRINRYIMECKFDSSGFIPEGKGRINRYIMECKCLPVN